MDTTIVTPDYAAIKQRQQSTWAAGDYAVVGTTLQIIGERLCEAVDLRAGERVLDVAGSVAKIFRSTLGSSDGRFKPTRACRLQGFCNRAALATSRGPRERFFRGRRSRRLAVSGFSPTFSHILSVAPIP